MTIGFVNEYIFIAGKKYTGSNNPG